MKKIYLERLIAGRKDEARKKQVAQKADLLVMALGEATGFWRDECGTDFNSPDTWEFQYQGMKIVMRLYGTSQFVEVGYRNNKVFSAGYKMDRAGSKRLAENLTKAPPLDAMLMPALPIEISWYLSGEWEAKLDRYARNPEKIRESYKQERLKRHDKEWKEKQKPKQVIDPATIEANEEDFKKARECFGIEVMLKPIPAEFRKYPPELRKHLQFLGESSKEVSKWPAWRRAGIVPMYDEKEGTK